MQPAVDGRSSDHLTQVRSTVEEAWMDVQAAAFEVRRDVGRAYQARERGVNPLTYLFAADRLAIAAADGLGEAIASRLSGLLP